MAKSSTVCALLALLLISSKAARGGGGRGGDSDEDSVGCCSGSTGKCTDASKTTCDRASTCEWISGEDADCSVEAVPGCCSGTDANCDTDDEAMCNKFAKRKGCAWISGADADCSVADASDSVDVEGCCIGTTSKCDTDDKTVCDRASTCDWQTDMPECDSDSDSDAGCCDVDDRYPNQFEGCQKYGVDEASCEDESSCFWVSGADAVCEAPISVNGCCTTSTNPRTGWTCEDILDMNDCARWPSHVCIWVENEDGCAPQPTEPERELDDGCCHGSDGQCRNDAHTKASCNSNSRAYGCEWHSDGDCATTTTEAPPSGCCANAQIESGLLQSDPDSFRLWQDQCDIAGTDWKQCQTYVDDDVVDIYLSPWKENMCAWYTDEDTDAEGVSYCSMVADSPTDEDGCCVKQDVMLNSGDAMECAYYGETLCKRETTDALGRPKCTWMSKEEGRDFFDTGDGASCKNIMDSLCIESPSCYDTSAAMSSRSVLSKDVMLDGEVSSMDGMEWVLPSAMVFASGLMMCALRASCVRASKSAVADETQPLIV